MTRLLAFLACLLLAPAAVAEVIQGVVFHVIDGDTLLLRTQAAAPRAFVKVRLADIDAPELDQPFGTAAKAALARRVENRTVTVVLVATDDWGRRVGWVRAGGVDVNRALVNEGLAWAYTRYHRNPALRAVEQDARRARRGLWRDEGTIAPWRWRHREALSRPFASR